MYYHPRSMASSEIDAYLAGVEEPKRSTLQELRQTILEVIPEAEGGISYQVPAFRLHGKVVAGFAAFKNHLSYLPHSGSVFRNCRVKLLPIGHRVGHSSSRSTSLYRRRWSRS